MRSGLALVAAFLWLAFILWMGPPEGDFANYFTAAWMVLQDMDAMEVYDFRRFTEHAATAGFGDQLVGWAVQVPSGALLALPLVPLGAASGATVWWALQGVLGVALAWVTARAIDRPLWVGFLPFICLGPALASHFSQGQFHLLPALAMAGGFWAWRRHRGASAGALWGLATGLKVHAWPLFLVALCAARWRVAVAFALVLLAGAGVSIAALGWPVHEHYLQVVGPMGVGGWFLDPWYPGFQTIGVALKRGLVGHPGLNPTVWADQPELAVALTRGAYLGAVLWTVARSFAWSDLTAHDQDRNLAAAAMVALVVGPLLSLYHLVALIPVLAWGVDGFVRRARWGAAAVMTVATALAAWSPWSGWLAAMPESAFLATVPRFWCLLVAWAVLVPWRPWPRRTVAGAIGALALASVAALGTKPATTPEGWERVDGPGFPLVAADLVRTADGALWFAGLTPDRQGHPGRGWVGYRLGPNEQRPSIVAASADAHVWSPMPSGPETVTWHTGPGGPSPAMAGRMFGGAWVERATVDLHRRDTVVLSDLGVGVRSLRLWRTPSLDDIE